MSFLESLLEELQEQLQNEPSDVTAAQVAEAADSERLNVTLAGGVMSRLKQQALAEGRSCSSLANFLIEDGLRRHSTLN
ncbi:CopG-like ribbon-helix-helix domain-containing protein [Synechococcus sp. BIOS-U3-1]|uniref:ribbon-helix-helix domain-containing protein n=1 Tax=Synechococcus sp. BIOS-U3-1 TaxID=1400865 RepID=UPI000C3B5A2C|nr:CopG family transcriptional regulator [Synechococcus sp. BIOS-U3-1]MAD68720.1 CopG family transcriptional regulator [Synechococcus sp. CPC100]QNI58351.1 CopG-like ribbon-helix-helix domain-containing protein [Synechococcus sp. BIOS-U3-1]